MPRELVHLLPVLQSAKGVVVVARLVYLLLVAAQIVTKQVVVAVCVCVLFTLLHRSFHPSTSSTPSVRADSVKKDGRQNDHKSDYETNYYTEICCPYFRSFQRSPKNVNQNYLFY